MIFLLKSILLGIVQGLTEFLPVSSSGHLAVAEHFLHIQRHGVLMETMLHGGTLVAVCIYYWKDILALFRSFFRWAGEITGINTKTEGHEGTEKFLDDKRMIIGLIIASVPTALIGFLAKDWFESQFSQIGVVGVQFLINAAILVAGETISARKKGTENSPGPITAFIVGVAQGAAIAPAISRSGATVASGMALGLKPESAVRFSFLMSIPAIMGAMVLSIKEDWVMESGQLAGYIVGPLVAAVIGYLSISVLIGAARGGKLRWFALYCAIFGAAVITASVLGL